MMVDWLLRDQVELAFASMLENHPGIEAIPLIQTHSVVLLPPGNPLAATCSIGVEDLDGVPLITMTRRYPSRHRIELGIASCRESMCAYVLISVVGVPLKH